MKLNDYWKDKWTEVNVPKEKIFSIIENELNTRDIVILKPYKHKSKVSWKKKSLLVIPTLLIVMLVYGVYLFNEADNKTLSSYKVETRSEDTENYSVHNDFNIIKKYEISKETIDLKKSIADVETIVKSNKGYFSESNIYTSPSDNSNWYAEYDIKVPKEQEENLVKQLKELDITTFLKEYQQNNKTNIAFRESQINAFLSEEEALLRLLEKSESISDSIQIQDRLSEIREKSGILLQTNEQINTQISEISIKLEIYQTDSIKKISFISKIAKFWKSQIPFWMDIIFFMLSYGVYVILLIICLYIINKWQKNRRLH